MNPDTFLRMAEIAAMLVQPKQKKAQNKMSKKKKQQELPGVEAPSFPEVEAAAETFRVARDSRMAAMKPEKEAKTKLLEAMKKNNLTVHRYEGENGEGETVEFEIERESNENVKVRSAKGESGETE